MDIALTTRLDGPAGAPWMVCSNSLATNLALWDELVAAFAGTHRILRYDQRGHGGSPVPDRPTSVPELADDLDALMAAHGVQDAVFVGASLGAATGLCAAARPGSRIGRLVAADGNAKTPPGGIEAWDERLAYARTHGMVGFADLTIKRWFTPQSVAGGHKAIPQIRAGIEATPYAGLACCVAALQHCDVTAGLGEIGQPTLLMAGAADGAMPAVMQALRDRITGSEYVEIAQAGHLPVVEQPAAFVAAVQAFIG